MVMNSMAAYGLSRGLGQGLAGGGGGPNVSRSGGGGISVNAAPQSMSRDMLTTMMAPPESGGGGQTVDGFLGQGSIGFDNGSEFKAGGVSGFSVSPLIIAGTGLLLFAVVK